LRFLIVAEMLFLHPDAAGGPGDRRAKDREKSRRARYAEAKAGEANRALNQNVREVALSVS
jgi:hypothetical protein